MHRFRHYLHTNQPVQAQGLHRHCTYTHTYPCASRLTSSHIMKSKNRYGPPTSNTYIDSNIDYSIDSKIDSKNTSNSITNSIPDNSSICTSNNTPNNILITIRNTYIQQPKYTDSVTPSSYPPLLHNNPKQVNNLRRLSRRCLSDVISHKTRRIVRKHITTETTTNTQIGKPLNPQLNPPPQPPLHYSLNPPLRYPLLRSLHYLPHYSLHYLPHYSLLLISMSPERAECAFCKGGVEESVVILNKNAIVCVEYRVKCSIYNIPVSGRYVDKVILLTRHSHDTDMVTATVILGVVLYLGGVERLLSHNGKGTSYQCWNMPEGWFAVVLGELRRMVGAGSVNKDVCKESDGVLGSYMNLTAYAVVKSKSRQIRLEEVRFVCVVCVDCGVYIWEPVKVRGAFRKHKSLIANELDGINGWEVKSHGRP